jgi:hypothetical protein
MTTTASFEAVQTEVTVCDAILPDMRDEYGPAAEPLCDARRAVLGCGGCACAQLAEIAQTNPALRADLGVQIVDAMHQGGAI